MLLPDMQVIHYYLRHKKQTAIQYTRAMIAQLFDHYADRLMNAFTKETGHSIFQVDSYEHRDNVD